MKKAKLIKKDSLVDQSVRSPKKTRKLKVKPERARTALEVTQEWLKQKQDDRPGAREAFALLFDESETQSA
ncbi:MAG: hypothetical protein ACOYLF_12245 [Blastocatellia bacterium]